MARARRQAVLVIEDDAAIARGLTAHLEGAGYRATCATSGEDGLRSVRSSGPDAVLLDINLPGIDGLEVCRTMRAEGYRGLVVMLTARTSSSDRDLGLKAGADEYLVKPIDARDVVSCIRSRLHTRHEGRGPRA